MRKEIKKWNKKFAWKFTKCGEFDTNHVWGQEYKGKLFNVWLEFYEEQKEVINNSTLRRVINKK